mmetsp:Transcript_54137/g.144188  ORF Transcript_54137/g.144188 Transcript_54137/m.144188 type:complete len:203 (-) Transcript_54137:1-609(-)
MIVCDVHVVVRWFQVRHVVQLGSTQVATQELKHTLADILHLPLILLEEGAQSGVLQCFVVHDLHTGFNIEIPAYALIHGARLVILHLLAHARAATNTTSFSSLGCFADRFAKLGQILFGLHQLLTHKSDVQTASFPSVRGQSGCDCHLQLVQLTSNTGHPSLHSLNVCISLVDSAHYFGSVGHGHLLQLQEALAFGNGRTQA